MQRLNHGIIASLLINEGSDDIEETSNTNEDSTEYRPQSCYVQELYYEHLPGRQFDIVHTISHCLGRSLAGRVGSEEAVDESAIDEKAGYKGRDAYQKSYHNR